MKIRNNKGLTLIEVLTVIVISGILLSMISVLFYSFTTMYQQLDHQNQVTNDIVLIKNSISKYISENDNHETTLSIEIADGLSKLTIQISEDENDSFVLYLDDNGSFLINNVRVVNKSAINKVTFSKNEDNSILKILIEYKTHYNRDDIQSQEFVKVLRCVKIELISN